VKTGSLRRRVILTILVLLAIVLAGVVAAVTLAYRAKLDGDLHDRLVRAGTAVQRAGSAGQAKRLLPGLALEGIAIRIAPPAAGAAPAARTSSTIQTHGSLLILDEVLHDGTKVSFSASRASVDHAVANLLFVELLVAAAALVLASLLVLQGTRTALRPLSAVIETATRIAHGDLKLRLEPSRTDTELGRLARAFDEMVDALERAIEDARASEAATRRFLADASHELRTPIAALQASVETLLREQPDRPERDRLEAAVARETERLGRLIDDLLGLARLEAHPGRVAVDLHAVVRPLLEEARIRAPNAAITLSADDDAVVSGDPDALERVLRNLIDNALAAIEPGGRIKVQLRRSNGYTEAHVADDGPGIPEHERERIFERFVRLDSSKPGHGLGLAIARRIAEQHDGELTCNGTTRGASFTLRIPAFGPGRKWSDLQGQGQRSCPPPTVRSTH
jgi:two-component system, OmpR family, sensor kinase